MELFTREISNENRVAYIGPCAFSTFAIHLITVAFSMMVCRNTEVMFFLQEGHREMFIGIFCSMRRKEEIFVGNWSLENRETASSVDCIRSVYKH